MEVIVSLKMDGNFAGIDLSGLIERSNGLSRLELVRLIMERQEQLIAQLCGPKYSRDYPYRLIVEDHGNWLRKG